ncbi:hypothetical protein D9M68_649350 [compost metagenome]
MRIYGFEAPCRSPSNPTTASHDPGLAQSAVFIPRIFHEEISPLKVRAPTASSPPICKASLVFREISRWKNAIAWLVSQSIPWHNRSTGTGRHLILREFRRNAASLGYASTGIPTQGTRSFNVSNVAVRSTRNPWSHPSDSDHPGHVLFRHASTRL